MPPKTLRAVVLIDADEAAVRAAARSLPSSVRSYLAVTGAGVLLTLEQGFPRGLREGLHNRRAGEPGRRRTVIRHLVVLAEGIRTQAQLADRHPEIVVAAALMRGGRVLGGCRAGPGNAGKWEFPGGKAEPGESGPAALVRECVEELGVDVAVGRTLGADVDLPGARVLRLFLCALIDESAEPAAVAQVHAELRWFDPSELDDVTWLATNQAWLPVVRDVLLSRAD